MKCCLVLQANHAVFMRHINDDASSTSSERYEKDVTVLNRCFDDIERFIARLQHAAAARRELERRRKYVTFQITRHSRAEFPLLPKGHFGPSENSIASLVFTI